MVLLTVINTHLKGKVLDNKLWWPSKQKFVRDISRKPIELDQFNFNSIEKFQSPEMLFVWTKKSAVSCAISLRPGNPKRAGAGLISPPTQMPCPLEILCKLAKTIFITITTIIVTTLIITTTTMIRKSCASWRGSSSPRASSSPPSRSCSSPSTATSSSSTPPATRSPSDRWLPLIRSFKTKR